MVSIVALTAVLLGAVLVGLVTLGGILRPEPDPQWQPAAAPAGASPSVSPAPQPPQEITMSATGDIVLGNAPDRLPPNGGAGFFDSVTETLAADLVMGNLEEPLTVDTGTGKCGADSTQCHQFRAPPEYAAHLRDAGFMLLNQANNHGYDFGEAGYRNTQQALEEHGLAHTGARDQITVLDVEGVTVAVAGFSAYSPPNNSLIDLDAAAEVVRRAGEQADLVVVQVHMGGEGSDLTRVTPGTELFLGENRGDPMAFSRAMIDAGADLIVGHGPHVLRGMEFYQGRLIAYSLGNFAGGGGTLSSNGRLGWGGVLKVSLTRDGEWIGGEFLSTYMNGNGLPTPDEEGRGLGLVRELSELDFPQTSPVFGDDGSISPPSN
ncbi:CapA family protein [Micromonospora sp. NBC_01813]|uniref:CapA family protein n=1 Tax=Micromonospora sp. NBC_01813 TaxID=2975988 RepID=UPI003FA37B2C